MARFEEAAHDEATTTACGHGRDRPAGRRRGCAPVPVPPMGHGRGAAPTAQAPQHPVGQVEEGEDEDDEEIDEEI